MPLARSCQSHWPPAPPCTHRSANRRERARLVTFSGAEGGHTFVGACGGDLIYGGLDGNWLYYGGAGSERLYKFVP